MSTDLLTRPETEQRTETGDPIFSHLIAPKTDDKGRTRFGADLLTEARVNGTPVTALCGRSFVPSRDGSKYPPCAECAEIFEARTGKTTGWVNA